MSFELHFLRQKELAAIQNLMYAEGTRPILLVGQPGSGKTTLLRQLHSACQTDSRLLPIFCSCKSEETVACIFARIEIQLATYMKLVMPTKPFKTFLTDQISHDMRDFVWSRKHKNTESQVEIEFGLISLRERIIDLEAGLGFRISTSEVTALFAATLRNVRAIIDPAQILGLLIDFDRTLPNDTIDILISAVAMASHNIRMVLAYEETGKSLATEKAEKPIPDCFLNSFSEKQVKELISHQIVSGASDFPSAKLWELFRGDPLLTDRFLRRAGRSSFVDSLPDEREAHYSALSSSLYADATATAKKLLETLAAFYEGTSPESLAKLTGMSQSEIISVAHQNPLFDILLVPDAHTDLRIDLFHPIFKDHLKKLIDLERWQTLRRNVGVHYLMQLGKDTNVSSYGAIISIPHYFSDGDLSDFIVSILSTFTLALFIGDLKILQTNVTAALDSCKRHSCPHEGQLLTALSLVLLETGRLEDATTTSLEVLGIIRTQNGPKLLESVALSNTACLLQLQGRLNEALKHESSALKIARQILKEQHQEGNLAAHLSNLGLIYRRLNNLEAALKFFEEALKVDHGIQNKRGMAGDLRQIGSILQDLGRFGDSIGKHLEALKLDQELNDLRAIAWDYGNLGMTCYLNGDPSTGIDWFKKALDIFSAIGAEQEAEQVKRLLQNPPPKSSE